MFTIRYFAPYANVWRTQQFNNINEANRMISFYKSCGSMAELVPN